MPEKDETRVSEKGMLALSISCFLFSGPKSSMVTYRKMRFNLETQELLKILLLLPQMLSSNLSI